MPRDLPFLTERLQLVRLQPLAHRLIDPQDSNYTRHLLPHHEPLHGVVRVQRADAGNAVLYRVQFHLLNDIPSVHDPSSSLKGFDNTEQLNTITAACALNAGRIRIADRADIIVSHALHGRGVGSYMLAALIERLRRHHPEATVAPLTLSGIDAPTDHQRRLRDGLYEGRGFKVVKSKVHPADHATEETVVHALKAIWCGRKVVEISREQLLGDPAFQAVRERGLRAIDAAGNTSSTPSSRPGQE